MPKINYVVACWGEGRTAGGTPAECMGYLVAQIAALNRVKHNLAQVTIVHPDSDRLTGEYKQLLSKLDGSVLDNGAPVVVMRRPNANYSYGSWSDAYGKFRQEFDHYIFMEDDYLPTCDDFDALLVSILDDKGCDYLCSLVSDSTMDNNGIPHAGVTVGICKSSSLEIIWSHYGSLLSDDYQDWYWHNQMNWSYPYHYLNLKIDHYADVYSVPFWYSQANRIEVLMDHGPNGILVPIQWYRVNLSDI